MVEYTACLLDLVEQWGCALTGVFNHPDALPQHVINVCIEEESHKRLPEDLQTSVDASHRGQPTNVVRLGDLNHFQVHPGSDFTGAPYFRSPPQSQSGPQSLSEGA